MMKRIAMFLMLTALIVAGSFGCCGTGMWQYKHGETPAHISNAKVIPVYVDSRFTNAEIVAINKVMQEWNGVFNGQIVLKLDRKFTDDMDAVVLARKIADTHTGWMIAKLESDDERLENAVEPGDGKLAFAIGLGGHFMVVLADRVANHDVHTILLHEMGHMLGADHVFGKNLMSPNYGPGQTDCIDKVTAMQVAFFNDLDPKSLNYCVTPDFK